MDTIIHTRVAGIPCQLRVTYWEAVTTATWYAPAEGSNMEFEVLDRRGRPAPWLARKLGAVDERRLEAEVAAYFRQRRYDD